MFEMTPEGRKRVDRNDAVRQTVPEFGSSNRESPATDSRQLDWWHHKTAGVSRTKRASTRLISDADKWSKVSCRASMQNFVRPICSDVSQIRKWSPKIWGPYPIIMRGPKLAIFV